jgi:hypothetical protein
MIQRSPATSEKLTADPPSRGYGVTGDADLNGLGEMECGYLGYLIPEGYWRLAGGLNHRLTNQQTVSPRGARELAIDEQKETKETKAAEAVGKPLSFIHGRVSPARRSRADCRLSKLWAHRLWR